MQHIKPLAKVALFNVGPTLEAIMNKHSIPSPMDKHDYMVINLWFAQMFERIHVVRANIAPEAYDFNPITPRDLTIINDTSFDTEFTKTVKWQMIQQCVEFIGVTVKTRLSASTLIVEF